MKTDILPAKTEGESKNTSSVRDQLLHNFETSKNYRHAFVEESVRTSLAVQIKAIREQRRLKQPDLAELMGKAQSWVSRLEDPNQSPPTIPSLLQVAEAFDVDLSIRFGSFSELLDRLDRLSPRSFRVPSFGEEIEHLKKKKPSGDRALDYRPYSRSLYRQRVGAGTELSLPWRIFAGEVGRHLPLIDDPSPKLIVQQVSGGRPLSGKSFLIQDRDVSAYQPARMEAA